MRERAKKRHKKTKGREAQSEKKIGKQVFSLTGIKSRQRCPVSIALAVRCSLESSFAIKEKRTAKRKGLEENFRRET